MSGQYNDPPYLGGNLNSNIKANINTALDLSQQSPGSSLPYPPILANITYTQDSSGVPFAFITVIMKPYGYPDKYSELIFQSSITGSGRPEPFEVSKFGYSDYNQIQTWYGQTGLQINQNYTITAVSGSYTSPPLIVQTGSGSTNAPSNPPTVPVAQLPPSSNAINIVFNVADTGGRAPFTYSFNWRQGTTDPFATVVATNPTRDAYYTGVVFPLSPSTDYQFQSVVSNAYGTETSAIATITTPATGGVAPSPATQNPVLTPGGATPSSLTFTFPPGSTTGTPAPQFGVSISLTFDGQNPRFVFGNIVGGNVLVTVTGLLPQTIYYVRSIASNGVAPFAFSELHPFNTTSAI